MPEQVLEADREPAGMPDAPLGHGDRCIDRLGALASAVSLAAPIVPMAVADLLH